MTCRNCIQISVFICVWYNIIYELVRSPVVNPPTGLMAVQDGLTSILVSWTAPASGGATFTGYRISYQTGGGSEQNVTVGPTATSSTLTGLQSGATYSISIVALSGSRSSTVVTLEGTYIYMYMVVLVFLCICIHLYYIRYYDIEGQSHALYDVFCSDCHFISAPSD